MLKGMNKIKNPMLKAIVKSFKPQGALFKPCPHFGKIELLDMTLDSKMFAWLPAGVFKFQWLQKNYHDKDMFKLTLLISIEK
jgi:hypothetical protein